MNTAPERDFRQHNNAEKIRLVRQKTKTCQLEDLNVGTRNGNDGFPLTAQFQNKHKHNFRLCFRHKYKFDLRHRFKFRS